MLHARAWSASRLKINPAKQQKWYVILETAWPDKRGRNISRDLILSITFVLSASPLSQTASHSIAVEHTLPTLGCQDSEFVIAPTEGYLGEA